MDDPGIQVCGGSFEALDRHAALVRSALLLEGDGVVEYSIGDQGFVDAACDLDSPIACTKGTTGAVFTSSPVDLHELVHAARVHDQSVTLHSSAIEEGLATLLGSDDLGQGVVETDAKSLFADPQVAGTTEYFRAGSMMALLLERYGADELRSFDLLASGNDEEETFFEAFGENKDAFAAFVDEAPLCEQSKWWWPLLECDGEPLVADPITGALTLSGNLTCSAPDVLGPDHDRIWTFQHFRLDQATSTLSYQFEMPDDATLEIISCEGGCPERFAYLGTRNQVGSVANGLPGLQPGEYFLRMSRPLSEANGRFEIVLD